MKKLILLTALFMGFALPAAADDRDDILAVVDLFFQAQRDRNPDLWQDIMLDYAMIMSHRERTGRPWVLTTRTAAGDLAKLSSGDVVIDERIYEPTVLVHKTIATVWAPYDIYAGDNLLHCGIDVFQLFKVEGQWKISHFAYTTEPEGCDAFNVPPRN